MRLEEFREEVYQAFGQRLERANETTLRAFLDRMQALVYPPQRDGDTVVLEEETGEPDYQRLVREFLASMLLRADEENLIALWLFTLELWFYVMQEETARQFAAFLREIHWEEED
jgi:hypothetical protein